MRKDVTMYIPTVGRTGNQKTWDSLPEIWKRRNKTFLVCPESERKAHEEAGRNVMVRPERCTTSGRAKQWIIENAKTKYILLADDDLRFLARKSPNAYNLRSANEQDMLDMLLMMGDTLVKDRYHHCALGARGGNNTHYPAKFLINSRALCFHGFNRETILNHDIRLDDFPLMQDFHTTLSLLELGYPNKIIVNYCHDQVSNAPGGCSRYRTVELLAKMANKLKKMHPDFVTVVEKKSKAGWGGMKTRTDVRIQWKKAFLSSGKEAPKC